MNPPDTFIYLYDGANSVSANVSFAGLAPGFAGLYQVNFTLPANGLQNGAVQIDFVTNEALNEMATIDLSGFPQTDAVRSRRNSRLRSRPAAAGATHDRNAKKSRRALPERFKQSS